MPVTRGCSGRPYTRAPSRCRCCNAPVNCGASSRPKVRSPPVRRMRRPADRSGRLGVTRQLAGVRREVRPAVRVCSTPTPCARPLPAAPGRRRRCRGTRRARRQPLPRGERVRRRGGRNPMVRRWSPTPRCSTSTRRAAASSWSTSGEPIICDKVVVATGSWTMRLRPTCADICMRCRLH